MALQDSTLNRVGVIICIHLTAHAIWCGTTSSADRVP
ncbi:hypothetical protein T12_15178 [Trichinella patagoniensis]|uniref:Uncharacterized protein n=1 Tax=Trichinella patagoniensis TaxID=990121 RepID=A0A0V0V527_9BILA|nr:hypothetical protein T12_15178 [Trichinella patagoniensis]